jgi:hypothetical protein
MCKELPVIPVNKVVDPKRIMGKMEGQGGGEAQGVADQKKRKFILPTPPYSPSQSLVMGDKG